MESIVIGHLIILLVAVEGEITSMSRLVNTKTFVDKTLLIKDLCDCPKEEKIKIVTAPPTFGKSVIIDMLRRFYSVQTDDSGNQISPNSTSNYRLFCVQKLKICENENYEYISSYLGKYPVLHFDFWPLGSGRILKTFLEHVSYVLHCAFFDHQYLLRNSTLWKDELLRYYFMRITSIHNYEHLRSKVEVEKALKFLLELIFRHFGRRFILLIDNYDALFRSMIEVRFEDEDSVVSVSEKLNELLLLDNNYLEHAWLSGVLSVQGAILKPSARVRYYNWLGDHRFSKYYGLTRAEVDALTRAKVNQTVATEREYREIQETLHLYYRGYRIVNQNIQLCNIWSVQEFFNYGMVPGLYWTYRNFRPVLRNWTQDLVVKGERIAIDLHHIFVQEEIEGIRLMIETGQGGSNSSHHLLFDLGYLTPTGSYDNNLTQMEIPNFEIHKRLCYEVRKFLTIRKIRQFHEDTDWLSFSVISLLKPNQSNSFLYKSLFEFIRYIVANAEHQPKLKVDIQTFLFLVLGAKFPVRRGVVTHNFKRGRERGIRENVPDVLKETVNELKTQNSLKDFNEEESLFDIAVVNRLKLALIITTKNIKRSEKNKLNYSRNRIKVLAEVAKKNLCQCIIDNENLLENSPLKMFQLDFNLTGRIYVSLVYDESTKATSMLVYDPLHDKKTTSLKSRFYVWETEERTDQERDTGIVQV